MTSERGSGPEGRISEPQEKQRRKRGARSLTPSVHSRLANPGPMARFEHIKATDPALLGTVIQRIADGESVRAICSAWQLPRREFREWLKQEGRKLVGSARSAPVLQIVGKARSDQKEQERSDLCNQ